MSHGLTAMISLLATTKPRNPSIKASAVTAIEAGLEKINENP
jgi:hypothetical protein